MMMMMMIDPPSPLEIKKPVCLDGKWSDLSGPVRRRWFVWSKNLVSHFWRVLLSLLTIQTKIRDELTFCVSISSYFLGLSRIICLSVSPVFDFILFYFILFSFPWIRVIRLIHTVIYYYIAVMGFFVLLSFIFFFKKKKTDRLCFHGPPTLSTGKWNSNVSVSMSDTDKLSHLLTCSSTCVYYMIWNLISRRNYCIPQRWQQTAVGYEKKKKKLIPLSEPSSTLSWSKKVE